VVKLCHDLAVDQRVSPRDRASVDGARTLWLESQGYRVIRFWNSDITDNMTGVLETIYAAIHGHVDAEPKELKHVRRRRSRASDAPRREVES